MDRKADAVLIESKTSHHIIKHRGKNLISCHISPIYDVWIKENGIMPYHLHLISDDELKTGDLATDGTSVCAMDHVDKESCLIRNLTDDNLVTQHISPIKGLRKIVASTNPSFGLPSIPESYILKFILCYNKECISVQYRMNDGITSVMTGCVDAEYNCYDLHFKISDIIIEEAAEQYVRSKWIHPEKYVGSKDTKQDFIAGAEFQASNNKGLYTEKEVFDILHKLCQIDCSFPNKEGNIIIVENDKSENLIQWFNRNKKK